MTARSFQAAGIAFLLRNHLPRLYTCGMFVGLPTPAGFLASRHAHSPPIRPIIWRIPRIKRPWTPRCIPLRMHRGSSLLLRTQASQGLTYPACRLTSQLNTCIDAFMRASGDSIGCRILLQMPPTTCPRPLWSPILTASRQTPNVYHIEKTATRKVAPGASSTETLRVHSSPLPLVTFNISWCLLTIIRDSNSPSLSCTVEMPQPK